MSTFKLTKSAQKARDPGIQVNDLVLVRLPNGEIKSVKITKNSTVSLGKYGSFHSDELVGQPYGLTYEIDGKKKLTQLPPRTLDEVEDTEATNELINDGTFVQPLTVDEIQTLKRSGAHASDIIKMQIEQHANYFLKTEYSKDKYKKRKEAKYSKVFTTIEPTLFNVSEYWFAKDQNRLRDLRIDSLSQVLNLAGIRPGGRYLAVDDASGLLVSGILERMGGEGTLITICSIDSPPAYPVLAQMNFPSPITDVMKTLNWATAEEDYTPIMPPTEYPDDDAKSERHKHRLNKRKAISDLLSKTRDDLFSGEFDALVIVSEHEPYSIIERLSPYLAGSSSVVVHSPYPQIVVDLQARLRQHPEYLSPSVTEAWLRRYQVLPGRTHPMMAMSGSGGFIMHTIKIYDDPNAQYALMQRRAKHKKQKTEEEVSSTSEVPSTSAPATNASTPNPQSSNIEAKS
ncbi:hypothetical protein CVT24_001267 [Panaeolus cyanescens]|uniref:tRNA (adenine(58)-N(1))-methyltransferase non-catalytic subunit TRM6 n=1 Tax=Panaeolus cyanescens TaxID=181874 RepID=A0A409YG11_9AGAR|nr:hypothetical protein CVT24_001267 [Panaeolus cyanescens]